MQKLIILNTREVKKISQLLKKQFNCSLQGDYAYLQNQKDKIYIINKDLAKIDLDKLRVDRFGLYFGEIKINHFRLSMEGAALLVKENKTVTNIFELTRTEVLLHFEGLDLNKDLGEENKQIILKYQNNILGCSQYKEKTILNFLPKTHRGTVIV